MAVIKCPANEILLPALRPKPNSLLVLLYSPGNRPKKLVILYVGGVKIAVREGQAS